nr:MAG TPA: hypothetical protein [Caudoviricetes sp.]
MWISFRNGAMSLFITGSVMRCLLPTENRSGDGRETETGLAASTQKRLETNKMANEDIPTNRDVWEQLNQARLEIAEIRGMIKMHFEDKQHHFPPCKAASDMQKTMLSATGAALLALMAAIGSIVAEFMRR